MIRNPTGVWEHRVDGGAIVRTSRVGLVAAAIAVGTAIAYLWLIVSEGENDVLLVAVVIGLIAGAGASAALGGSVAALRWKRSLLGLSTGVLLSLGIVSLFSIGLFLFIAGVIAGIAWIRSMVAGGAGGRWIAVGAMVVAAALPPALLLAQDRSQPPGCRTVGENRVVCISTVGPPGRSSSDGGEVG